MRLIDHLKGKLQLCFLSVNELQLLPVLPPEHLAFYTWFNSLQRLVHKVLSDGN